MTAEIRAVLYCIFIIRLNVGLGIHGARRTCVQQARGCHVLARDDTIIIIEDLGLAAFERPFTKPFVIFPIGGKKNLVSAAIP